jgi:hypothetical protein
MLAIREERGNNAFAFPLSQRPARTLAIISSFCEESEIWLYILSVEQKATNGLFATLSSWKKQAGGYE